MSDLTDVEEPEKDTQELVRDTRPVRTRPVALTKEERQAKRDERAEAAIDQFGGMVQTAIATVLELCEMADSEPVRLSAAQTIFKMAGVDPGSKREVNVSIDDKRAVREELEQVLKGLARNNPGAVQALTAGEEIIDADVIAD